MFFTPIKHLINHSGRVRGRIGYPKIHKMKEKVYNIYAFFPLLSRFLNLDNDEEIEAMRRKIEERILVIEPDDVRMAKSRKLSVSSKILSSGR